MGRRKTGRKAAPYALAAFVLLAAGACGVRADGPPSIEVDRTGCAHCQMLVSDVVYAAALRVAGAEARVFDDIGCMAAELRQAAAERRVWVHDFETGEWIDGDRAVFVHSATLRTPMGGGFVAFKTRAAAERVAREKNGRVLASLAEVLASGGKDGNQ
jgi:copper chaperone NosL